MIAILHDLIALAMLIGSAWCFTSAYRQGRNRARR
jgi:hypothetical protein